MLPGETAELAAAGGACIIPFSTRRKARIISYVVRAVIMALYKAVLEVGIAHQVYVA
jgi:hypothetical protein